MTFDEAIKRLDAWIIKARHDARILQDDLREEGNRDGYLEGLESARTLLMDVHSCQ